MYPEVFRSPKVPLPAHSETRATPGADERLLASTERNEWTEGQDPLRVLRMQAELSEGFAALGGLPRAVSVFGSARTKPDHPAYALGVELGAALVAAGYAVITGGGPGAMEAANKGAQEAGGLSVGLGIELPFEQAMNPYLDLGIEFHYFFARKVNFCKSASAFVVLPGGMGTLDELFEALTLVQTGKITQFPIVLMGVDYWSGLVEWLRESMLAEGYISPGDLDLFTLTDSVEEAVAIIQAAEAGLAAEPTDAEMASAGDGE